MALFRRQAITARRHRLTGTVVISQPAGLPLLVLLLTGMTVTCAGFLAIGTYARKETVPGFLSPDSGIARVRAPRPGVIRRVFVMEGQRVAARSPLLTIDTEIVSDGGVATGGSMLQSVGSQLEEIDERILGEGERTKLDLARLRAKLDGLKEELDTIDDQLAIQRELILNQTVIAERLDPVAEAGYISRRELLGRRETLLRSKQVLASLQQKRVATSSDIDQAVLAVERVPAEAEARLSNLRIRRSELLIREAELSGRRSITLVATVPGIVSGLQAVPGSSVSGERTLLSILPEGGSLKAFLYVPTSAIGFVKPGQQVRIRYDAFDHRQFGLQPGLVSSISAVPLYPGEIVPALTVREPAYRVTVILKSHELIAQGHHFALQPGMLLSADIVLGRRTLLARLLDPLSVVGGR